MPDVRTETGKRIAILAHCLLNQNAKPHLRARFPGIVDPILDVLRNEGFALLQLPCPEVAFAGMKRFSQVIEQYDTPKYRAHCKDLAVRVVDQVEHYSRYGCKMLILGIDGSPSCGVQLTGSNPAWQGYPGTAKIDNQYPVKKGTGIFIQELKKELESRELKIPPAMGIGLDLHGIDLKNLGKDFERQLKTLLKRI